MSDPCYVYFAIRRQKENPGWNGTGPRVIREVDRHLDTVSVLKDRTARIPGIWRIYRSVNRRDLMKTDIELAKVLIDRIHKPNIDDKPVDKLWKSLLMQPRNKFERKYLVDFDSTNKELYNEIIGVLKPFEVIEMEKPTPNGMHIICKPFDVRLMNDFPEVSVHKDGLLYMERYTID